VAASVPTAADTLVSVRGLVREREGRLVLNGVDLDVRRGEVVVLAGANASGKSTFLDVLAGHLAPHGGEARVAGIDVARHPHGVRRQVGYVPEELPPVEGLTAEQYLELHAELLGVARSARREAVDAALARVGLEWHAGRPTESFSAGERRRLELAQALLGDRQVLLLDEPFAGVDPASRAPFRESLRRMGVGKAMLLGTHRLDEADGLATRMVILSRGEIAASIDVAAARRVERVFLRVEGAAGVSPAADLAALAEALRFTAGVAEVTPDAGVPGGGGFWITPAGGVDPRAAVAHTVLERGLRIINLSSAEPRLQDAYRRWHSARQVPAAGSAGGAGGGSSGGAGGG
jgi:ABC-type multidrug transport system ATPase subunit